MRLPSASSATASKLARAPSATELPLNSGRMPIKTSWLRTGMSTVFAVTRPPGSWMEIFHHRLQRQGGVGQLADRAGGFGRAAGVGRRHRHLHIDVGEAVVHPAELPAGVSCRTASDRRKCAPRLRPMRLLAGAP